MSLPLTHVRELAKELRLRLMPLGEGLWENATQLEAMGFCSFQAEFQRQLLFSQEQEREVHRKCATEAAKEMIGNGPLHTIRADGPFPDGWESPFLRELRRQRLATSGVMFKDRDSTKHPGWSMELDPCLRRVEHLEKTGAVAYKNELQRIEALRRELRKMEIETIATEPEIPFEFSSDDRLRFYAHTSARLLEPHGFSFDKKRSRKTKPVFSRITKEGWRLSWELDWQTFSAINRGGLLFKCDVVPAKATTAALNTGQWNVVMPHLFAAPLSHLYRFPYATFESIRELEVVIAAHVAAFVLTKDALETAIRELASGAAA